MQKKKKKGPFPRQVFTRATTLFKRQHDYSEYRWGNLFWKGKGLHLIIFKSTLTKFLSAHYVNSATLRQDDFYKRDGEFEIVKGFANWDSPLSFRMEDWNNQVNKLKTDTGLVFLFLEGLYLLDDSHLRNSTPCNLNFFLHIAYEISVTIIL